MKIVISARRFHPPLVGGVDVYAERLIHALERLGHDISVISYDSSAKNKDKGIEIVEDEYEGNKVWRLSFDLDQRPKGTFQHAYDPEMGEFVKKILQAEKPDLLIVMNFYLATLATVEVAKELGLPVLHIATDFIPVCRRATFIQWDGKSCERGEGIKSCSACYVSHHVAGRVMAKVFDRFPEETLLNWAKKDTFNTPINPYALMRPYWKQVRIMKERIKTLRPLRGRIDLVFAPTKFTHDVFLANGFLKEQVYLLPFSVESDNPLASVEHVPAEHTRFLFIGRLQPYKGAHLLVEAFNNLKLPKGATLTIYGTNDGYEDYFDRLMKMINSNKQIRFSGKIPPEELHRAFSEADYFVLPSTWHENSPLIILDALQSRTPVIASDVGGVNDLVENGKNGILFPMGDHLALQGVLQQVIDRPELLSKLRNGIDLLDIDKYTRRILQLCEERGILSNTSAAVRKGVTQ